MSFNASLKALLLCLLTLTLGFTLSAQEGEDVYRGTWQIDTPDDGTQILIIKRNGRASYFWGDNADRTVYQGTWVSDENGVTLSWADGNSHRITRDTLGYAISYSDTTGRELYTTQAELVPKEVLGQWAKAPSKPEEQTSDRDKAKGFFGTWEVEAESGNYYVIIEPNRSAATNWSDTEDGTRGLRGSWAKQGSELHIVWDTGHYTILKENERDFSLKVIPPGTNIGEDESEPLPASRTSDDNIPQDWFALYNAEKETNTGGIAFASYKDANAFYRGSWIIQHRADAFELIEISRFGGLKTSSDRTLEGTWRMTGQDIFMRWDDGMRKVLSPIGYGFVLYEYKPGRPIDGVPTRILPATPQDAAKLVENLQGRKVVAQQMHELAEAAGINTTPDDTGLGQTFMRWAWPFSDDDQQQSTDALLQEGYYETGGTLDPWWWPFWSEKPVSEDTTEPETTTDVETDIIEVQVTDPNTEAEAVVIEEVITTESVDPTSTPEAETEATEIDVVGEIDPVTETEKTTKPGKQDWKWPF